MGISITSVRHESSMIRLTLHACDVARSKEPGDFEINCCFVKLYFFNQSPHNPDQINEWK